MKFICWDKGETCLKEVFRFLIKQKKKGNKKKVEINEQFLDIVSREREILQFQQKKIYFGKEKELEDMITGCKKGKK
jgi:hypothetical protein